MNQAMVYFLHQMNRGEGMSCLMNIEFGMFLIALIAVAISLYSLGVWRKQLKTQNELDAAKKVLKYLYMLKEEYKNLRKLDIDDNELPNDDFMDTVQIIKVDSSKIKYVYGNRFKKVSEVQNELFRHVLEGQIYFDKCKDNYDSICSNIKIVFVQIINYLDDIHKKNSEEASFFDSTIIRNNNLDIDKNVYESINKFEIYLKQYVLVEKNWIDSIFFKFNPFYK